MRHFLEWWVVLLVQGSGLLLCQYFGLFEWVWEQDKTKISYLILFIWSMVTLYCGRLSFLADKNKLTTYEVEQKSELGWFSADILISLGMLGTVIGLLLMMSGIDLSASKNVLAAQEMLKTMSLGMSTAMITTACGIIFGNLIKLQFFLLTRET